MLCFGDEILVGSIHGNLIINDKENNVINFK